MTSICHSLFIVITFNRETNKFITFKISSALCGPRSFILLAHSWVSLGYRFCLIVARIWTWKLCKPIFHRLQRKCYRRHRRFIIVLSFFDKLDARLTSVIIFFSRCTGLHSYSISWYKRTKYFCIYTVKMKISRWKSDRVKSRSFCISTYLNIPCVAGSITG